MISKTFNRYIWLMNTLLQYKQLTFEEINVLWMGSCLGDGTPLLLRTFHQHKNAVEELFGVEIKCNPSKRVQILHFYSRYFEERQYTQMALELIYPFQYDNGRA